MEWLRQHQRQAMVSRYSLPTPAHPIRMKVITWNVGAVPVPPESLLMLLEPAEVEQLHFIVVGLQESKPDTPQPKVSMAGMTAADKRRVQGLSVLMRDFSMALGDEWLVLRHEQLGAMQLTVFCRQTVRPFVTAMAFNRERTGKANHMGKNKGGIFFSMRVGHSSFSFVSAHLAAHQGEDYLERRISDAAEIFRGTFKAGSGRYDVANEFDHVIWLGDLNFRFDVEQAGGVPVEGMSHEEQWETIAKLIEAKKWDQLFQADELYMNMREGRVLAGFTVLQPPFQPTFKLDRAPGYKYKKQRIPAWCDRIVWRSLPNCVHEIVADQYRAYDKMGVSDHKPVSIIFTHEPRSRLVTVERPLLATQEIRDRGVRILVQKINVKGLPHMDQGKPPDPYLCFMSTELFGSGVTFKTHHRTRTDHASWDYHELPTLSTIWQKTETVEMEHLFVRVMDWDLASDDLIGFAVVGLEAAASESGINFEVPIIKYGRVRGTMSGTLQVRHLFASL
eukprot:m.53486 g.53486  ORF g.53486 m.53486 type:complete len:505 (+) comp13171_c0_seq1:197-1711(+)